MSYKYDTSIGELRGVGAFVDWMRRRRMIEHNDDVRISSRTGDASRGIDPYLQIAVYNYSDKELAEEFWALYVPLSATGPRGRYYRSTRPPWSPRYPWPQPIWVGPQDQLSVFDENPWESMVRNPAHLSRITHITLMAEWWMTLREWADWTKLPDDVQGTIEAVPDPWGTVGGRNYLVIRLDVKRGLRHKYWALEVDGDWQGGDVVWRKDRSKNVPQKVGALTQLDFGDDCEPTYKSRNGLAWFFDYDPFKYDHCLVKPS